MTRRLIIVASLMIYLPFLYGIDLDSEAPVDTVMIPFASLDSIMSGYLADLKAQGYWNTRIEISDVQSDSQNIKAFIVRGSISRIGQVHFLGVNEKAGAYLNREFFLGRQGIEQTNILQAEARLRERGYYLKKSGAISKDASGNFHQNYSLRRRPELNIDALAAFNQSAGSDTVAFFGHIYLYVPNLDGRGKSIRLNWKRLKTDSELFSLSYEHPWLFNIPLMTRFSFGREVVDGNYQVVESTIGLEWTVDWERTMIFQFEDRQSFITYEGSLSNPEWISDRKQLLGLGYKHYSLDKINHSGIALKTLLFQEINFEPGSVTRLDFRSEAQIPLLSKLFISQRNALSVQNETNAERDPSTMKALGGVGSVRGYEEDGIRSRSVASFQHDLYYLISQQSRFIGLLDAGIYTDQNKLKYLMGYGVGVQLNSGRGPIRLIVATHQGLSLQNSFLHIEYSGGISWIDR